MRLPHIVKRTKCIFDIRIDPGFATIIARLRACCDNAGKGLVRRDDKPVLTDGFCQGFRQTKAFQWQYRALFGLDPECIGIVARVGHRENAIGISAHQQIQINRQW